jgi:hypothetical protein
MGTSVLHDLRLRARALMADDEGARELYLALCPPEEQAYSTSQVRVLPAAEEFMRRECRDLLHRWPEAFGAPTYDGSVSLSMIGARAVDRRIAGFTVDGDQELGIVLDNGDMLIVSIAFSDAGDAGLRLTERMRPARPSELAMAALEREGAESRGGG